MVIDILFVLIYKISLRCLSEEMMTKMNTQPIQLISKFLYIRRRTKHCAAVLCLAALIGCLPKDPVAPSGEQLSISANPTQIGQAGQSTITINGFQPDGNPLATGTLISVSTSLGTIQRLDDFVSAGITSIRLGTGGSVRVRLIPDGRSGTATVSASLRDLEVTVQVVINPGE